MIAKIKIDERKFMRDITVETASVPPYIIKIDISFEYENNVRYEDFFSDILDAIVEVYKSNKIKV